MSVFHTLRARSFYVNNLESPGPHYIKHILHLILNIKIMMQIDMIMIENNQNYCIFTDSMHLFVNLSSVKLFTRRNNFLEEKVIIETFFSSFIAFIHSHSFGGNAMPNEKKILFLLFEKKL